MAMRQWATISFVCPICFELVSAKFNVRHPYAEVFQCEECHEHFTMQVSIQHVEEK